MTIEVSIGSRVDCDGARGTIKYIGEVLPTTGLWYGIDWDDPSRGKHSGFHNGVQYFVARHNSSGSFIRPHKVKYGVTFEDAVRAKYQDSPDVDLQATKQFQQKINARFVEIVGMEFIHEKQRQLFLETVVLDNWCVVCTHSNTLQTLLPRLKHLDISDCLLSSWLSVAEIVCQLPIVKFLNVSGNSLEISSNSKKCVKSFGSVTHLVMCRMLNYRWDDIVNVSKMFSSLINLQIASNEVVRIEDLSDETFLCLEEIDISKNPIKCWKEINKLGNLPRLQTLNVSECKIEKIIFSDSLPDEKTSLFGSLRSLIVVKNPLQNWESVCELSKLNVLEELIISHDAVEMEHFLECTIAVIKGLKMLNRTSISYSERKDYELFYLKKFSSEYFSAGGTECGTDAKLSQDFLSKYPRYVELVKYHDAPVNESQCSDITKTLSNMKIVLNIVTPDDFIKEKGQKTFLLSTKLSKVKMMIKRQLKLSPTANLVLSYCPSTNPEVYEIEMDHDSMDLNFFSVASGDILFVRW